MPSKKNETNKEDEVIDLRSRIEIKPKTSPIKIVADHEAVPKVKAGIGKVMLIVLILLAGVALVAGWIFLSKPQATNKTSLKIVVDAPTEVKAGVPFNIKIDYENIDIATLKKLQLTLDHSPLWHLQTAEVMPEDDNQSFWKLEDLPVGGTKQLNLTGVLYGETDQVNDFKIKFNYQPENFSSQFEDNVGFSIKINRTYFTQKQGLPTEINLEDSSSINLTYSYEGGDEATSTDFELILPEGVKISSSTPTAVNNIWHFDSWPSGDEQNLAILLTAERAVDGQWKMEAKKDGVIVGAWTGNIKVTVPNLLMSLERIGSSGINYGDNISAQINISNNGKEDVVIDNITVSSDSDLINWSKVNVADAEVNDKQITWTAGKGVTGKDIKTIKAGEIKQLNFSLPLIAKKDVNNVSGNQTAFKLNLMAQTADSRQINGTGLELNISSPFSVSSIGRYFASADSPVGSGPLPPQVGKKTTYQIVWTVTTGEEGLKDLKLTSTLPSYVVWEGQDEEVSGGGQVNFNSSSKKISWDIKQLVAHQQSSVAFMVSITPSDSQINQFMVLTNATNFTAKKEIGGGTINNIISLITSELPGDPLASGKGRVQAQ